MLSNVLTVAALQALGFTEATDPTGATFWVGPNQARATEGLPIVVSAGLRAIT